jgi:branched-chain amino acid transport system substrate-binding protein
MKTSGRSFLLAVAAVVACALITSAPALAQGVKIGVLADQSGTYADFDGKGSVEAAKMAIEDFGGSVLGQKIELVDADHQDKVDVATTIARRWYDVEGVDMISDLTLSSVALAVQQITSERKKIDIVVASSTPAITGSACTPYGFHWAYDSHALAVSTGGALVRAGADTWFFVTVDYAAGHAQERDATEIVTASGGKVFGHVLFPLNTPDFSSFLLQAQSSKAKVVALATGGQDVINAIKQAAEFGIVAGGQRLATLLLTVVEVHGLGLEAAQGLVLTESYYWDLNDRTREFGERFFKRTGRMPNMVQAGMYSATLQYLKVVKAAGTKDADAVAKKLKELPVNDAFTANGHVQANGRMVSDVYLFQVKKPSESKGDWDYYNLLATVPGHTAYPTAANSGCPLTK